MAKEIMRPIDPETAGAVEATANFGTKLLDTGNRAGGYVADVLGRLPHNLVGLVNDWVEQQRVRNYNRLISKTHEILQRRRIGETYQEPSPSVAIPLLESAVDETRQELQDLWAKLLAAAMDPGRVGLVRQSLIAVVKQMDPLDARILEAVDKAGGTKLGPNGRDFLSKAFKTSEHEILVSFDNLERLKVIAFASQPHIDPLLAPLGRVLMMATRD